MASPKKNMLRFSLVLSINFQLLENKFIHSFIYSGDKHTKKLTNKQDKINKQTYE